MSVDHKVQTSGALRRGTSNPVSSSASAGGVARNVAESLARLGCQVSLLSVTGDDAAGDRLREELDTLGVDLSHVVRSPHRPTASYTAVLESGGTLSLGLADMDVMAELDVDWAAQAASFLAEHDYWVIDANLLPATLERLLADENRTARVVAEPVSIVKSERLRPVLSRLDVLFPDKGEAAALSGLPSRTIEDVPAAAARLRSMGPGAVIVSLGPGGVYVDDGPRLEFVPALPSENVVDVTGAGDALVAGWLYGELEGVADPVRYGLAAASLALESTRSVSASLNSETLVRRAAEPENRRAGEQASLPLSPRRR